MATVFRLNSYGLFMMLTLAVSVSSQPMVALDCYHNNEATPHYTWSQTAIGGFSQLAGIVWGLGADTMSISSVFDSAVLSKADLLIIVDPDTTTEATSPKYITAAETLAVNRWVMQGGVLMMLTNNAGNCEFTHINWLASQFGIRFNADTYSGGYNLTPLPAHDFFSGCETLYIKDISTLTLTSPAQAVLTLNSRPLMATSKKGAGTVFALGDPWLYNEYINTGDNFTSGTNVMRWLLAQVPSSGILRDFASAAVAERFQRLRHGAVLAPNGRKRGCVSPASGVYLKQAADGSVTTELFMEGRHDGRK